MPCFSRTLAPRWPIMPKTPSTVFLGRAASKSGELCRMAGQPSTRSDWVLSGMETGRRSRHLGPGHDRQRRVRGSLARPSRRTRPR